jgi:nicotinate dehydrogenase subunit A
MTREKSSTPLAEGGGREGSNPQPTTITVNGTAVTLDVNPTTPLLDVLRNTLNLKGARFGCGLEQCGTCMVLLDGEPAFSCAREVGTVAGRTITTVEALAGHPLIEAFIAEQAGQCGYCLSGILIGAKALLDRDPNPTRADITTALDRHLCRCGAHNRIIRAIQRAATTLRETAPA